MKKTVVRILILALLAVICAPICVFAEADAAPVLPEDVEAAIIRDYAEANRIAEEDVRIEYYGEYDGCHVGFFESVESGYLEVVTEVCVGSYTFRFSSSRQLIVYKDGQFLKLDKAYAAGWLTDEGAGRLWNYYAKGVYEPSKTGDSILMAVTTLLFSGIGFMAMLQVKRKMK